MLGVRSWTAGELVVILGIEGQGLFSAFIGFSFCFVEEANVYMEVAVEKVEK
jgi:hypothetical protein